MPVTISPTRAAPGDIVEAVISGAPFDLRHIQIRYLIVALQEIGTGAALSWISPSATAVNATTLRFVVPGTPSPGTPPMRAGFKRVVFRFGMWQDRASSDLEVVAVAGIASTSSTGGHGTSPMPATAGVHLMQITPDTAAPGQTVTARLLDSSITFTALAPAAFSVWLTEVGTGIAVNYRILQYRAVDPRTIEFTVPPFAGGFHPGGFRVVMRYGFWEGRSQRDLRVVATAPTSTLPAPIGPRGMAFASRPAISLPVPASALGVGWPGPLASALAWRPATSRLALAPMTLRTSRLVPIIPMPNAAMPIFMAHSSPGAMATPVSATLPANTNLSNLNAVCRGRVRDRIDAFFSLNTKASRAAESVRPIVDGVEIAPAIAELIRTADDYLYVCIWALDQHMRLSADGQTNSATADDTIVRLIKKRAAESYQMSRPLEVKLLIWASIIDDEYAPGATDLEELTSCMVQWNEISSFDPDSPGGFLDVLRSAPHFCAAPTNLLIDIFRAYKHRPAMSSTTRVQFPSGISVATQPHPALTGSHHQKLVITRHGAYIGGMNLVKEYWDSREHDVTDPRRDSSGGPASGGGAGGSFMSVGSSGILHDTGSIVRGPAIEQALEVFAMRWDEAVAKNYVHERLVDAYDDELLPSIANQLQSDAEKRAQQIRQRRVIDRGGSFNGAADAAHTVEDIVVVTSLPSGCAYGPVEDVKSCYLRAVTSMTSPESFAFMETQYFYELSVTKQLYQQWRNHPREIGPFAFVLLPYNPSTAWVDELREDMFAPVPGVVGERLRGLEGEFVHLRWLEIQTARCIYTQESVDAPWRPLLRVDNPRRQIEWDDSSLQDLPTNLELDSEFTVKDAVKLDRNGAPVLDSSGTEERETRTFEANEVMTDSDIMAFCAVGSGSRLPRRRGRDYMREYLLAQEIYVHSKAAVFLNPEDSPSYATIGSANLNPRSLSDGNAQDSELNVWFAGRDRVDAFWRSLASEHMAGTSPADVSARAFARQGWENLRRLFVGDVVQGNVVRLDVADRFTYQRART